MNWNTKRPRNDTFKLEFCDQIIDHMAEGKSIISFAHKIGVAVSTIYDWARKHEEFKDAIMQGESARFSYWEDALIRKCEGDNRYGDGALMQFYLRNSFSKIYNKDKQFDIPQSNTTIVISTGINREKEIEVKKEISMIPKEDLL